MPNRMIKEQCRTSKTLDKLTADAERFFWRLITVADDFGRFEADADVLLCSCFPRKAKRMPESEIEMMLQELTGVGLVHIYESEGTRYGYFPTWDRHQQRRAKTSKFPPPPSNEITCLHMQADASTCNLQADASTRNHDRSAPDSDSDSISDSNSISDEEGGAGGETPSTVRALLPEKITGLLRYWQKHHQATGEPFHIKPGPDYEHFRKLIQSGISIDAIKKKIDAFWTWDDEWARDRRTINVFYLKFNEIPTTSRKLTPRYREVNRDGVVTMEEVPDA